MKRYLVKGVIGLLAVVALLGVAQPALAWVRVGINIGIPFRVVVGPVAAVATAPAVYAAPAPVLYRPVWIPGHVNRRGVWVHGHWR